MLKLRFMIPNLGIVIQNATDGLVFARTSAIASAAASAACHTCKKHELLHFPFKIFPSTVPQLSSNSLRSLRFEFNT